MQGPGSAGRRLTPVSEIQVAAHGSHAQCTNGWMKSEGMTTSGDPRSLCDPGQVYFPLWACFPKATMPLSSPSSQQVAGSIHFPRPRWMPAAPALGLVRTRAPAVGHAAGPGTPDWSLGSKHHAGALWRGPCAHTSPAPVPLFSLFLPWEPLRQAPHPYHGPRACPDPSLCSHLAGFPSPLLGIVLCWHHGGCWVGRRRSSRTRKKPVEKPRASALCGCSGE